MTATTISRMISPSGAMWGSSGSVVDPGIVLSRPMVGGEGLEPPTSSV